MAIGDKGRPPVFAFRQAMSLRTQPETPASSVVSWVLGILWLFSPTSWWINSWSFRPRSSATPPSIPAWADTKESIVWRIERPAIPGIDPRQALQRIAALATPKLFRLSPKNADADDVVVHPQRKFHTTGDAAAVGAEIGVVAMTAAGLDVLGRCRRCATGQKHRRQNFRQSRRHAIPAASYHRRGGD